MSIYRSTDYEQRSKKKTERISKQRKCSHSWVPTGLYRIIQDTRERQKLVSAAVDVNK